MCNNGRQNLSVSMFYHYFCIPSRSFQQSIVHSDNYCNYCYKPAFLQTILSTIPPGDGITTDAVIMQRKRCLLHLYEGYFFPQFIAVTNLVCRNGPFWSLVTMINLKFQTYCKEKNYYHILPLVYANLILFVLQNTKLAGTIIFNF